jgi:hypothetical protein
MKKSIGGALQVQMVDSYMVQGPLKAP